MAKKLPRATKKARQPLRKPVIAKVATSRRTSKKIVKTRRSNRKLSPQRSQINVVKQLSQLGVTLSAAVMSASQTVAAKTKASTLAVTKTATQTQTRVAKEVSTRFGLARGRVTSFATKTGQTLNQTRQASRALLTQVITRPQTSKAKPAKKKLKKTTLKLKHKSGVIFNGQSRVSRWWNEFKVSAVVTGANTAANLTTSTTNLPSKIKSAQAQTWSELKTWLTPQARRPANRAQKIKSSKKSAQVVIIAPPTTLAGKLAYPFVVTVRRYPWQTFFSLTLTISILVGSYFTYIYIFKDLPSALELSQKEQVVTTKILDRNGKVLFRIYEDENRTLIPLSAVPQHMIQATIAIEDKDFYHHHGFSVRGMTRAVLANLKNETVQGGSTITQQLVKNRLLSPEKTLQRKVKEIILAVLVDGTYEKDEILSMYFNEVAYGGNTYGVEEAAHRYFDKSAQDLTLAESALLAGLPQAPSIYSPFGPTPELAYARQEEVLRRMVEDQYITVEQADAAKKEVLTFRTDSVDILAPHFVMYIKKMLAEQYGEDMVSKGGLEVRTTLDLDLQQAAQKQVTDELAKLARLRISNGAALVTNPKTGEVLAMVGSKDYFDVQHDGQVNVTLRPRQPGSSIKPLTYAVAMERGKTPSSVEDDSPISYYIPGSKPYSPKNYDGKFHGRVSLREALGSSYNIPAVKLLASVGINTVIDKGQQMGITTWNDRQRFGLSLTLGGGEVLMIDMVELYGTFANQGYTVDINPLLEVTNYKGETLYRNTCALDNYGCPQQKTLDTRVAYYITDILKDNNARTPAFGPRSVLTIPGQEVAVKTGTTNNLRDNWTIGYTTDRLVAVWVGNNDNTPMSYVASGVTGASPIWNNIIRLVLDEKNPHKFGAPEGMIKVQICARTGTLPCAACPAVKDEYFIPGTEPKQACTPAQFAPPRPKASPQPGQSTNNTAASPAPRNRILQGVTSP